MNHSSAWCNPPIRTSWAIVFHWYLQTRLQNTRWCPYGILHIRCSIQMSYFLGFWIGLNIDLVWGVLVDKRLPRKYFWLRGRSFFDKPVATIYYITAAKILIIKNQWFNNSTIIMKKTLKYTAFRCRQKWRYFCVDRRVWTAKLSRPNNASWIAEYFIL